MDFFADKMLEDAVKAGYDADEIKEAIIMVLKPYFENESVLQKYATHDQFLTMFSYIVRYHSDEMFSKYLHEVIGCYRLAFLKNKKEVTKMITSTANILSQKENMMWTVKKNTPHNLEGDIYEATYSYMKHLGDNLEIGLKHKLAELYGILKISLGENIEDYDKILNTKFGVIMQNLIDKKKFSPILMTSFPKLRLSDWRNIAYHSSYEVIGKRIICTYGKNNDSVELTLEMLRKCVAEIIKSCNIIDIGRRVFIFDNLNIWDDVSEEDIKVHDRKDMKINQLKISLISQGFKIRKSEISAQRITIFLNDLKRSSKVV